MEYEKTKRMVVKVVIKICLNPCFNGIRKNARIASALDSLGVS